MRACALKSSFEGKKDFLMSRVSRSCRDFPDSSRSIVREKGQQDRRVGNRKKWTKSQHKIRRRRAVGESSLQQAHGPICPSNLTREAGPRSGVRSGARGGTVLRGPVQYCRHCPAILPRLPSGQPHPLTSRNRRNCERVRAGRASSSASSGRVAVAPNTRSIARARRQRRDGPGSGARAEAVLPGSVGNTALVARKTSGGSPRDRPARGPGARANTRPGRIVTLLS
jgi:hypothetical protein